MGKFACPILAVRKPERHWLIIELILSMRSGVYLRRRRSDVESTSYKIVNKVFPAIKAKLLLS